MSVRGLFETSCNNIITNSQEMSTEKSTEASIDFYRHQIEFSKLYPKKAYMAWEVGTGKTISALLTAQRNSFKKLLVVAPRSAHQSWISDNKYFNLDLTIITYETFRDKIEDVSVYDLVVFDEAHRLSYTKTNWTKKALKTRSQMRNVLMLSGTPADKLHKLYAQLKILTNNQDPMFKQFLSYTSFIKYYFELDDYFKPKRVKLPEYEKELKDWFQQYAHIVKRDDVIELPDLLEYKIKLQPQQLEIDLSNYDLANFIKEYRASAHTKDKYEFVFDFISDNKDTIVFSLFKEFVQEAGKKLGKNVYAITGETPKKFVEEILQKQDKPIITTYVISEGANLQKGYRNIVFASLPLKYIDYEQAVGRVYRAGQKKKVALYTLLQNDIDYAVYKILNMKKDVVELLKKVRL